MDHTDVDSWDEVQDAMTVVNGDTFIDTGAGTIQIVGANQLFESDFIF